MTILLASSSPRRKKLFGYLGVSFQVESSRFQEPPQGNLTPLTYVRQMAKAKAQEVSRRFPQQVVLAADTVVVAGQRVLGKPQNSSQARKMLKLLSGRWHRVITAVAFKGLGEKIQVKHCISRVLMKQLNDQWIVDYIQSGYPMDKAGAYGIQDEPWKPVAQYKGCWCNIVGLPLTLVSRMLQDSGIKLRKRFPDDCADCGNSQGSRSISKG